MSTPTTRIEQHPDIVALRLPYEEVAETRTAQIVDGFGVLLGVYVAASPWIVGFNNLNTLAVNNLIIGVAMALFAMGFASAYGRTHGISWVAPLLGVWLVVSPWAVQGSVDTTRSILSNVIAGGLFVLSSGAAIVLGVRRARRGGRQRV